MNIRKFATVEIPFLKIGDELCLTSKQLAEQPWLAGFVARFPDCFERGYTFDGYVYRPLGKGSENASVQE